MEAGSRVFSAHARAQREGNSRTQVAGQLKAVASSVSHVPGPEELRSHVFRSAANFHMVRIRVTLGQKPQCVDPGLGFMNLVYQKSYTTVWRPNCNDCPGSQTGNTLCTSLAMLTLSLRCADLTPILCYLEVHYPFLYLTLTLHLLSICLIPTLYLLCHLYACFLPFPSTSYLPSSDLSPAMPTFYLLPIFYLLRIYLINLYLLNPSDLHDTCF